MRPSVIDPISHALNRTGVVLFRPFQPVKWLVLGFAAFLASLGSIGFHLTDLPLPGGPGGGPPGPWLLDQLHRFGPLLAGVLMVGLALAAGLIWLQSRGKFIFLASLSANQAAIVAPWKAYRHPANSLFRFQMLVLLATIGVGLLLTAPPLWLAWPDLMSGVLTRAGIGALALATGTLLPLVLIYLLIGMLIEDFIAPAMFARQVTVRDAWRLLRTEVFAGHLTTIVLFYLMRLLIGAVLSTLTTLATCLTCCLTAVPYLGTVILLPLIVFQRCYALYFLEQFGSAWQIFVTEADSPPRCTVCGYDLRGNPDAPHCPECGAWRSPPTQAVTLAATPPDTGR